MTVRSAVIVTRQTLPEVASHPAQLVNIEPAAAVAVTSNIVPDANDPSTQSPVVTPAVLVHAIPTPAVIVPVPAPAPAVVMVLPDGGVTAATEKFAFDMSKKMLPTASTLMRAVVVVTFAIVTDSVPSFAVLAARTVGNVTPPSVDNEIFTLAALTGAAVVPATFQVTV